MLSISLQKFANALIKNGWVTINGVHVFIDDDGNITKGPKEFIGKKPSELSPSKSELARANYKPSTREKQLVADKSEAKLSKALGIKRTPDNAPFDLHDNKRGIEVKTLVDNKNDKITMHPESRARKLAFAKANGLTMYTVVCDMRGTSKGTYFFAKGVGSFRIRSMQKVSLAELRGLIA